MSPIGMRWSNLKVTSLRGRLVAVLAMVVGWLGVWAAAFAPGAAAACLTGTVAFTYTGAEQCYGVPAGVTSVQVAAIGAPGAGDGSGQGFGAAVAAVVPVSSGETLYVEVGGAGSSGGFNGGGAGGGSGGAGTSGDGGGGASDVRSASVATSTELSLGSRLLVAGGGGGGTGFLGGNTDVGGNADQSGVGAFAGMGGGPGGDGGGGSGGSGATCSPGAAQIGPVGTFGEGGAGGTGTGTGGGTSGGGGGGGGYYGGGGGQGGTDTDLGCQQAGGGGGGSSYVIPSASAVTYATDSTGVPSVTITPQTPSAPPQGPAGPQGLTGAKGATGATGPVGSPGKVELVVCNKVSKTVTSHGHKHKVTVQKCTTRLVSGTAKFVIDSDDPGASVSRAGITYATGLAITTGTDHLKLVFTRQLHRLGLGRYTLTLRNRHGKPRILERRQITIT